MKKQVLISLMLFFAALSTILTLSGSANAQVIYARVELENFDRVTDFNFDNEEADLFVRLYSNSACTVPYIVPADMQINLRYDYSWSDIYQTGSNYYYGSAVIPAGESEVYHNRVVTDGNDYWGGYWPGSEHIWTHTVLTYMVTSGTGYYASATIEYR